MSKFGRTLTDREYGKKIAQTILNQETFPLILDFQGVISLGSSCGDEIFNAVGSKQGMAIQMISANAAIKACIEMVAEDSGTSVVFL